MKWQHNAAFSAVFGFGERFDALNQIGLERNIRVYETFTDQGGDAYLPVPFCITDGGFGVYFDTTQVIQITTEYGETNSCISAELPEDTVVHMIYGSPAEILDKYTQLTGRPVLPPEWAFGLWMSANRWNTQVLAEQQVEEAVKHGMKPSVIVLEAWSDEATFYRFDRTRWPEPAAMINRLHESDIRCILWQIPVLKKPDDGQFCPELNEDRAYAVKSGYVVRNPDSSPYLIPEGRWFGGSMVPDFTNPAACKWWFGKRQYLLDMGVDGFKTDGGEFLYDDGSCFYDGSTGAVMQNGYALAYTKAYASFIGKDRVLFSRAGFTGSQTTPLHWAGDQKSTWEELRHVLNAGLNAGLSGIPFWGFDIAGFAGKLPSKELYLRAFAMACYSPVMQWHSEPSGGQFSEIMPTDDYINDRSPWNIAERYGDSGVINFCRRFAEERERLKPYLLEEAKFCAATGRPLMAPLFFDAFRDKQAYAISDQYMLGRILMIAPVLHEGITQREVYFPAGEWRDYRTGMMVSDGTVNGGTWRTFNCDITQILVFCT